MANRWVQDDHRHKGQRPSDGVRMAVSRKGNGHPMGSDGRICASGRGDRIRTCDPLNPIQVRYQAALLPARHTRHVSRAPRSVKAEWEARRQLHGNIGKYGERTKWGAVSTACGRPPMRIGVWLAGGPMSSTSLVRFHRRGGGENRRQYRVMGAVIPIWWVRQREARRRSSR
jgi:hypothetical protein